jgi:polyferredoxin
MALPKRGCAGCGDMTWNNGQCGSCKRCHECCPKLSVKGSCAQKTIAKESKMSPAQLVRRRRAQDRYTLYCQRENFDSVRFKNRG